VRSYRCPSFGFGDRTPPGQIRPFDQCVRRPMFTGPSGDNHTFPSKDGNVFLSRKKPFFRPFGPPLSGHQNRHFQGDLDLAAFYEYNEGII
jgi:hypothetical protein